MNHSCASPCSPPSEASHPSSPSQRKRRRKSRSKFSDRQLESLEKAFKEGPHLTRQQTKELGEEIGLQQNQVQVWFQNRRCKQRKYLAARSRLAVMQTEPFKGYPNAPQFISHTEGNDTNLSMHGAMPFTSLLLGYNPCVVTPFPLIGGLPLQTATTVDHGSQSENEDSRSAFRQYLGQNQEDATRKVLHVKN